MERPLVFALLLLAVQAAAPAAPAPAPSPAPADRIVCRSAEVPVGSMLPAKRQCRRKSEWAAIDAANRRGVDRYTDALSDGGRGRP